MPNRAVVLEVLAFLGAACRRCSPVETFSSKADKLKIIHYDNMASAVKRLRFSTARCVYWTPPRARPVQLTQREWQRPFSVSALRCEEKGKEDGTPAAAATGEGQDAAETVEDVTAQGEGPGEANAGSEVVRTMKETGAYDSKLMDEGPRGSSSISSSESAAVSVEKSANTSANTSVPPDTDLSEAEEAGEGNTEDIVVEIDSPAEAEGGREQSETMMEQLDQGIREAVERSLGGSKADTGFWHYAQSGGKDKSFIKDNVTSQGHEELERQREYREYARLAAWELPLMSSKFFHLWNDPKLTEH